MNHTAVTGEIPRVPSKVPCAEADPARLITGCLLVSSVIDRLLLALVANMAGYVRLLISATLWAACLQSCIACPPWTPDSFPNPKTDLELCGRGGKKSNICDPDGVLSTEAQNRVEGTLLEIYEGADPYVRAQCGDKGLEGYQVGHAGSSACQ